MRYGNFPHARQVCRYAEENFNHLVTACDINVLARMFPLRDGRNAVIHVDDLLPGQSTPRDGKISCGFAFFVPDGGRSLADMHSEAL